MVNVGCHGKVHVRPFGAIDFPVLSDIRSKDTTSAFFWLRIFVCHIISGFRAGWQPPGGFVALLQQKARSAGLRVSLSFHFGRTGRLAWWNDKLLIRAAKTSKLLRTCYDCAKNLRYIWLIYLLDVFLYSKQFVVRAEAHQANNVSRLVNPDQEEISLNVTFYAALVLSM